MLASGGPSLTGHIVLVPAATPHRPLRLVRDVDLLSAATIASVRMNRPTCVFEPPATLAACARCLEAYAEARKVIEEAGGIAKWMEWVAGREGRDRADLLRRGLRPDLPGRLRDGLFLVAPSRTTDANVFRAARADQ
jgi:hypothetical protein